MNANLNRKAAIAAAMIAGTLLAFPAASAPPTARITQVQAIPNLGILVGIWAVSCTVSGTPVDFPDDIRFRNTGNVTLPMGTSISWYVHSSAYGVHTLSAPLAPGQYAFVGSVIPGGWPAGTICSANIL